MCTNKLTLNINLWFSLQNNKNKIAATAVTVHRRYTNVFESCKTKFLCEMKLESLDCKHSVF